MSTCSLRIGYDPLPRVKENLLTNFFVLGVTKSVNINCNKSRMPFYFQYVLILSFTLHMRCQISILAHCYRNKFK